MREICIGPRRAVRCSNNLIRMGKPCSARLLSAGRGTVRGLHIFRPSHAYQAMFIWWERRHRQWEHSGKLRHVCDIWDGRKIASCATASIGESTWSSFTRLHGTRKLMCPAKRKPVRPLSGTENMSNIYALPMLLFCDPALL